MLHACFYTICLVFRYTSKVTQEIFSELDETKAEHPEIYRIFQRTEDERRGATWQPHHRAARPTPGPRPLVVRPPWPTSVAAPSPIKTPRREKPKHPITFPEYIAIRRHRRPEIGRVQKLFSATCRRGESSPEVFFITMVASGAMSE
jgi:hypothetical protein